MARPRIFFCAFLLWSLIARGYDLPEHYRPPGAPPAPPPQLTVRVERPFVDSMRSLSPQIAQQVGLAGLFALSIDSYSYLNCVVGSASPICLEQFSENAIMNNPLQFAMHMALFTAGYSGANWIMNRKGPSPLNPLTQKLLGISAGSILASSFDGVMNSEHFSACLTEIKQNPQSRNSASPLAPLSRFSGPQCSKSFQEFTEFMTLKMSPQIAALAMTVTGAHALRQATQVTLKGIQFSPTGRAFRIVYSVGTTGASMVMFMNVYQFIESLLSTKMTEINRVYLGIDHPSLNRLQADLITAVNQTQQAERGWIMQNDHIEQLLDKYTKAKSMWIQEKTLAATGVQDGFIKKTERMVLLNNLTKEFYRSVLFYKSLEDFGRNGGSLEEVPSHLNYQNVGSDLKFVQSFIERWNSIISLRGTSPETFSGMFPRAINNFQINHVLEFLSFRMACGSSLENGPTLVQKNKGWLGVDGNPYDFSPPRLSRERPAFCASAQTSRVLDPANNLLTAIHKDLNDQLKIDVSNYQKNSDLRKAVHEKFESFWSQNVEAQLTRSLEEVIERWNLHVGQNVYSMLNSTRYYFCVPAGQTQSLISSRNSAQCSAQKQFDDKSFRGLSENPIRAHFDDLHMLTFWTQSALPQIKNYLKQLEKNFPQDQDSPLETLLHALERRMVNWPSRLAEHQTEVQFMISMLDPRKNFSSEEKQQQLQKISSQVEAFISNQNIVVQEISNSMAHLTKLHSLNSNLSREALNENLQTLRTFRALHNSLARNLRNLQLQYASIMPAGMEFR